MNGFAVSGALIILVITLVTSLTGLLSSPKLIEASLFRPYWFLRHKRYDTLVMSGLVHADFGHLIFNTITFYFFAFPLERRIGTLPFIVLYVIGLLLSHSCTLIRHHKNPNYATLGASGAISAVLFAYIVYFPASTLFILPIPFPIPAFLFAIGYVAYSWWAGQQQRGRINHDAHLCGALSGLLFVTAFEPSAWSNVTRLF